MILLYPHAYYKFKNNLRMMLLNLAIIPLQHNLQYGRHYHAVISPEIMLLEQPFLLKRKTIIYKN
jgi:hypothetical protein